MQVKNTAVVIPTYNSKKSITRLVSEIIKSAPFSDVYVVDDNSPDGTAKVVLNSFSKSKSVHLIKRGKKGGRGSAVLYGFFIALKNKKLKYFIEMDSDLCHDPRFIKDLVAKCRSYDIVIASRYLKESKNKNWKLKRQIFSRVVSFYLKLILGIPIKDYTNGYRCYKRKALEGINFESIKSKGFFVLTELSHALYKTGCKFSEIPFDFTLHQADKSNLNFGEIKSAFFGSLRIKLFQH